jgi:hypothetical protein
MLLSLESIVRGWLIGRGETTISAERISQVTISIQFENGNKREASIQTNDHSQSVVNQNSFFHSWR